MNKTIKTVSLALLLCVPTAYGMESLQNTYDVMKIIFEYAMWIDRTSLDNVQKSKTTQSAIYEQYINPMMWSESLFEGNKYTNNQNGLLHTIRRNHYLQYVSKNFKSIFWDYFKGHPQFSLQEKDEVINTLLRRWNQGNFHITHHIKGPIPNIPDIAIRLGASLYPILSSSVGSIYTNRPCNPEFVRAIVDVGNSNVINQPSVHGYTPLMRAIMHDNKNSHLKVVKLLLTRPDIQVNPMPKQPCSLFWATHHYKIEIIKLLLAHPDMQINAVDGLYKGETALFAAVHGSQPNITTFHSVINLLINAGADDTIKNTEGQTALDVARSHTYTAEKAEVLEQILAIKK